MESLINKALQRCCNSIESSGLDTHDVAVGGNCSCKRFITRLSILTENIDGKCVVPNWF